MPLLDDEGRENDSQPRSQAAELRIAPDESTSRNRRHSIATAERGRHRGDVGEYRQTLHRATRGKRPAAIIAATAAIAAYLAVRSKTKARESRSSSSIVSPISLPRPPAGFRWREQRDSRSQTRRKRPSSGRRHLTSDSPSFPRLQQARAPRRSRRQHIARRPRQGRRASIALNAQRRYRIAPERPSTISVTAATRARELRRRAAKPASALTLRKIDDADRVTQKRRERSGTAAVLPRATERTARMRVRTPRRLRRDKRRCKTLRSFTG